MVNKFQFLVVRLEVAVGAILVEAKLNFNSLWYDQKNGAQSAYVGGKDISIPCGTIRRIALFSGIALAIPYFNSLWYDQKFIL